MRRRRRSAMRMQAGAEPNSRRRSGQVAVEMAFVAPLVFLFIFAVIEFSRAQLAIHCMEGAAHAACRTATLEGATVTEVEEVCEARLRGGGITVYNATLTPSTLETAEQWAPVTVAITANYSDVCWLPVPKFLGDIQLSTSCTLPREPEPESTTEE